MIRVYSASDLQEAQLLIHLLAGRRIVATIANGNASSGLGDLPVTHPEIWLLDDRDLDLARQVISEYEDGAAKVRQLRVCAQCSERNPGSFDLCWQCGTELAD